MRIENPKITIISNTFYEDLLKVIEIAGRNCYKSEHLITEGSAEPFIKRIIDRGHESVLEHGSISVNISCDRGVTHELVRHRLCAFSQSSTRYCNYSKNKFGNEITVIKPIFWEEDSIQYNIWKKSMERVETDYLELLYNGATPEEARSVLPNSLQTDIAITANIREWRHIFKLRLDPAAHPQMREIMFLILSEFKNRYSVFFEDIN